MFAVVCRTWPSSCWWNLRTVTVLLLLFQFVLPFFLFLWLPRLGLLKLCWIKMVKADILVLFLIIEEMLLVFTIENDVCCGLSYMAFIMLMSVPSVPTFWKVFIVNGCWILSEVFPASIEMIVCFFLFFNLLIRSIILMCIFWRIFAFMG